MSVWKGIAQDALIMNIDDLLCVGATENIMLSSTIGRNKGLITGEVLSSHNWWYGGASLRSTGSSVVIYIEYRG